MKKTHIKNLAARALYMGLFLAVCAPAYATATPAPVVNTPVGVVNNAPINLNSNRTITPAQRVRVAPDTTSAAAHNARLQQQQKRQSASTKIKSPFPAGFSDGYTTGSTTTLTPEQAANIVPEKPYVPPRPATSSVPDDTQKQTATSTGAPSTPYTAVVNRRGAGASSANAPKAAPYTAPSAYNGLSRR